VATVPSPKHGRYSIIERELAELVRAHYEEMRHRATSARGRFFRHVYAQVAARPFTVEELDRLRDAVMLDRLSDKAR
jgi:hypothetical protein